MSKNIALQLYSVREQAKTDYEGTVRKIAKMGYTGVETAGFPGTTAEAASKLFKELGLTAVAAHSPMPLGENQKPALDAMKALGSKYLVCPASPRDIKTLDEVKKFCAQLNESNNVAKQNGLKFGFHNHWWEYQQLEGKYVYQVMMETLSPDIFFELDTYWIKTAGVDPVKIVKDMGARSPLLHIKDGPGVQGQPHLAAGTGVVDIPGIIAAGKPYTEWYILEMDSCATDMLEAVDKSCQYLKKVVK